MPEFTPPSFLTEGQDNILQRMREALPADIDTSAGGFAYDYMMPTANEEARFLQFALVNAVQMIFPQYASDQWLDLHAENRGITRKAAQPSVGHVTVIGKTGTVVSAGTVFSTTSVGDTQSVDFAVTADTTIPDNGSVLCAVKCTQAGLIGNVAAGTIVLKDNKANNVTSVNNESEFTGGTEIEDDESLRARVLYIDQTQGASYVGSISDYKRWALAVPGTGSAIIIPASDDTGLVKIVLTDSNGAPASTELCTAVYNYIMHPESPELRLAPVNANLSVVAPEKIEITISATVELDGAAMDKVKEQFSQSLLAYFANVPNEKEIRYTRIASMLSDTQGVHDYKDLQVNGGTKNIPVGEMATPVIGTITLSGGDV